ncbi:MAG: M23 family metallopeptidase [Oceanibaculum sp.]
MGGTHAGRWHGMKGRAIAVIAAATLVGLGYFAQDLAARDAQQPVTQRPQVAATPSFPSATQPATTQQPAASLPSTAQPDRAASRDWNWLSRWFGEGDGAGRPNGFSERDLDPSTYAHLAATQLPEGVIAALQREPTEQVVTVKRGDTLMKLLVDAGIERGEAHQAIEGLSSLYDPRQLRPGQDITLTFLPPTSLKLPLEIEIERKSALLGLSLQPSVEREVQVRRDGNGGFAAEQIEYPLQTVTVLRGGRINSSLYETAIDAGIPIAALWEMVRAFSFDVDFQRDIQRGDRFDILFDELRNEAGDVVNIGTVHYASMTLSGKTMPIFRFEPRPGEFDFFDPRGESVRKALLRTPIDGARLSSGYGMRRHPILGFDRMHRGIDFAAPTGTPIMAAGSGTIAKAEWFGAYGRYISVRHNNEFSTAYAHLSRFAPGIRAGVRVQQGQVIGYVGTTGSSTGPHLHYEVLKGGTQVNPINVKFPAGEKLEGKALARFQQARQGMERQIADLRREMQVAVRPGSAKAACREEQPDIC